MVKINDDIWEDKEFQNWKKFICAILGHEWHHVFSWLRFCERCDLLQISEKGGF